MNTFHKITAFILIGILSLILSTLTVIALAVLYAESHVKVDELINLDPLAAPVIVAIILWVAAGYDLIIWSLTLEFVKRKSRPINFR